MKEKIMKEKMVKISIDVEVNLPQNTAIITNSIKNTIVLCRCDKKRGIYRLFKCNAEDITSFDLLDESFWTPYTREELEKILEL